MHDLLQVEGRRHLLHEVHDDGHDLGLPGHPACCHHDAGLQAQQAVQEDLAVLNEVRDLGVGVLAKRLWPIARREGRNVVLCGEAVGCSTCEADCVKICSAHAHALAPPHPHTQGKVWALCPSQLAV